MFFACVVFHVKDRSMSPEQTEESEKRSLPGWYEYSRLFGESLERICDLTS